MKEQPFLAFDLGAESGRAILGQLEDGHLSVNQLSRFANEMENVGNHLRWNVDKLFSDMADALSLCAERGVVPASAAVDTWGVDFGFLGRDGKLLEQPFSYRDHRTDGMMEKFFELVPRRKVYELTGIQFMQLNTLFQLFAASRMTPALIGRASSVLFMPDIFNHLLTGEVRTEYTIATTSQLLNPRSKEWVPELFSAIGVPLTIMQNVIPSGTRLGRVCKTATDNVAVREVEVIAVASHDTGSAIVAVPAEGDDWAYISSGTWSLMGVETKSPIITDDALDLNFTNEGGFGGTIRFLKNIMGMWLIQQCRKEWSGSVQYDYEQLMRLAEEAAPFRSLVDPDDPVFFYPESMTEAICTYCSRTGQNAPGTHAEFVRCILESLALKYRTTLEQLRRLTGKEISTIHIIGGGAQNKLMCQYASNAMGLPVVAGPVEATAIGNIMVQALALGSVDSLQGIRTIVRRSFSPVWYQPMNSEIWNGAYQRFRSLVVSGK